MNDIIRHLRRRGALSGGVLYAASPARRGEAAADDGDVSQSRVTVKAEIVVETSPAEAAAAPEKQAVAAEPAAAKAPAAQPATGFSRDTRSSGQPALFGGAGKNRAASDLPELERTVAGCTECALHETRTNTVFAAGDGSSRLVFIGEAPGRDEDEQGIPFVGRAGKLLDKMIAAIGFSREEVYICNILKCRPPNNRDPKEEESAACEKYLARQLELVDPVIICALGRVAGQNLLGTRAPLKVLRQGMHHYNGIRVIVTYHPAALLRNPHWKKPAWEDLKMLKKLHGELTGAAER